MTVGDLRSQGAFDGLGIAADVLTAVRITGHASGRRFYRLQLRNAPRAAVLVVYPAKQQAEIDRHERTTAWLQAATVRVPRVLERGARALLVEDGGDGLLSEAWENAAIARRLYDQAATVIVKMQQYGARHPLPNPGWALDFDRLRAELEFAERYAIAGRFGASTGSADRSRHFDRLAALVAELPRVACHRDFHARNLLVVDDRVWVIDFQDLMPGPIFYDAASLIWDNYCDVESDTAAATLASLWRRNPGLIAPTSEAALPATPSGLPAAARQAFCLTGLQRSIKALGTFGYQFHEMGNRHFADYVPRTWRHVRRAALALGWHDLLAVVPDFGTAANPRA